MLDILLEQREVLGLLSPDTRLWGEAVMNIPILGGDDYIKTQNPAGVQLVNALGSVRDTSARRGLFQAWQLRGYRFADAIHPNASISRTARLGEGLQVMAGAVVNSDAQLGANVIVNSGAVVEHDCILGDSVHVAPGAVVLGGVKVGNGTHVGAGATVVQNLSVGEHCLIAAGAVVVNSVTDHQTVMGVPAKVIL